MDWESKIEKICEANGIDPNEYNKNSLLKEIVAKKLGFPDFDSFQKFPNPSLIIKGMGNPLLQEHSGLTLDLSKSCIDEIQKFHTFNQNIDSTTELVDNFLDYVRENFNFEYIIVAIKDLTSRPGIEFNRNSLRNLQFLLQTEQFIVEFDGIYSL